MDSFRASVLSYQETILPSAESMPIVYEIITTFISATNGCVSSSYA